MAEQTYHRPVLLDQTIEALGIRPDGIYLDGTAGGGGHSHAIASRLTTGRLIFLDRARALEYASRHGIAVVGMESGLPPAPTRP